MAPVTATAVGIARQVIDDPKLVALMGRLKAFDICTDSLSEASKESTLGKSPPNAPVDVEKLVEILDKWPSWRFQEQADLFEWMHPLDVMDAALSYLMRVHPALLLISASSKSVGQKRDYAAVASQHSQADSFAGIASVPATVTQAVCTILRFLCHLLKNATNKTVFNSVEELSDLLAASDDRVSTLALEALSNLSCPPLLHRQKALEMHQHSTALHTAAVTSSVHVRLMALARGWGSRGSGLGLAACVNADDSVSGQGSLPRHAGELTFEFYYKATKEKQRAVISSPDTTSSLSPSSESIVNPITTSTNSDTPISRIVRIHLSAEEILSSPPRQAEKRRRTASSNRKSGTEAKPTAELFSLCLKKAGGRDCFPRDKLFELLAQLRLAKSFYSNVERIAAVERRLRALICTLNANSSQDIMAGYFHAQPELCVELVDLVRPTVSPASVSSTSLRSELSIFSIDGEKEAVSAMSAVANSSAIPYTVRTLAIETLTALVSRRDGENNGGLTNVARQTNVLGELGVGKGQFLGLLPTLIRYSLASLTLFLTQGSGYGNEGDKKIAAPPVVGAGYNVIPGLDLGLAFLKATKPTPLARQEQEEKALEFIDVVLTLTSAVVSVPSGAAALTDCGLIPALVSTVAVDSHTVHVGGCDQKSPFAPTDDDGDSYSDSLLKFVTAQAIQILEGAIVTHNNALLAFYDLKGVDLLVMRLHMEVEQIKIEGEKQLFLFQQDDNNKNDITATASEMDNHDRIKSLEGIEMQDADNRDLAICSGSLIGKRPLQGARRALLFSIVNCLTVVFHQQESTSAQTSTPSGGVQLRKAELTNALIDIMENVSSYGGIMAALTATLLSDVMNADPQVVHHVHSSGIAKSFLAMLMGKSDISWDSDDYTTWCDPNLPVSSELVMALPSVISALSLTDDGAKEIRDSNPFPALLAIFCSPKYAMPQTRCLLNEMAAIMGTGLDDIMRHVPSLKQLVMKAIMRTLNRVLFIGKQLVRDEEFFNLSNPLDFRPKTEGLLVLENSRTCFMQYAYNMGQLLEHVLHSEDNCTPFFDIGGLDAILELYPLLISTTQLLSHVSCQSSPSIASLTHSTTTTALTVAIKSVASHCEPHKIMKKLTGSLNAHLDQLGESQLELRKVTGASTVLLSTQNRDNEDKADTMNVSGMLENIPRVPLHHLDGTSSTKLMTNHLSYLFRDVIIIDWLTSVLSVVVRVISQRSYELGSGWGRSEREWKKEISSAGFDKSIRRLSNLHRSALFEVCRIRTEAGYEARELLSRKPSDGSSASCHPEVYRLRIVCAEGAVVRDGTEIDSCASVGGLEMGEIVDAYDRCINSSGVMRYRTRRGWISEQTRGHSREPIAEVLSVRGISSARICQEENSGKKCKRIECGLPDLCSISASVLARVQNGHTLLLSSLSRITVLGMRSLPLKSFQHGLAGAHIASINHIMSRTIQQNFTSVMSSEQFLSKEELLPIPALSRGGTAMYLGSMLNLLHACLYEEKRDRLVLNVSLLLSLMYSDGFVEGIYAPGVFSDGKVLSDQRTLPVRGFLAAIRFVLKYCLMDMAGISRKERIFQRDDSSSESSYPLKQRVSRCVAASVPPTVSLLRRLLSCTLLIGSQASLTLSSVDNNGLKQFLSSCFSTEKTKKNEQKLSFHPARFARSLYRTISDIVAEVWTDPRFSLCPAHVLHPLLSLLGEVLACLEESCEESALIATTEGSMPGRSTASPRGEGEFSNTQRGLRRNISAMNAFLSIPLGRDSSVEETNTNGGASVEETDMESSRAATAPSIDPSGDTVNLLTEMGFSREHAWAAIESTESNRLEVAMEYALAHPPPSPGSIERNRAIRTGRREMHRRLEEAVREPLPGEDDTPVDADERAIRTGRREMRRRLEEAVREPLPGEDDTPVDADERANAGAQIVNSLLSSENNVEDVDVDSPSSSATSQSDDFSKIPQATVEETKEMSDDEKQAQALKNAEARSVSSVQLTLKQLKSDIAKVSINIIEGGYQSPKDDCSSFLLENNDNEHVSDLKTAVSLPSLLDEVVEFYNGEAEASTVVVTTFLLEYCGRYPHERLSIAEALLTKLKSYLQVDINGGSNDKVMKGQEGPFASMCHAAVMFLRALPRTRPTALRQGLVTSLLHCIRNFTSKLKTSYQSNCHAWPRWLAPSLLFLDIMAQPTAASLDSIDDKGEVDDPNATTPGTPNGRRGEYARVCMEHKKQVTAFSKASRRIFACINDKPKAIVRKSKKNKENDASELADSMLCEENQDDKARETHQLGNTLQGSISETLVKQNDSEASNLLVTSFPSFLPLMTHEIALSCLSVCIQLLRSCQCNGRKRADEISEGVSFLPPNIAHATVLLLTRVLRSHKVASQCLKMGGSEFLLSLPLKSRFSGNAGLITVALRRMIEDESTLQTAMETEIRITVAKLHKKQSRSSDDLTASIGLKPFVLSVTPLICRDPIVFLKAMATSVSFETSPPEAENRMTRIVLLSAEDRAKRGKEISECFHNNDSMTFSSGNDPIASPAVSKNSQHERSPSITPNPRRGRQPQKNKLPQKSDALRSKFSHRSSSKRKLVKNEKHGNLSKKYITLHGSPANHIISLLFTEMIKTVDAEKKRETELRQASFTGQIQSLATSFLWAVDFLEIIADLVLAVPACAAAIHRYQFSSGKDIDSMNRSLSHFKQGLLGFPCLPRNAVTYLLHNLLPQPRVAPQKLSNDHNSDELPSLAERRNMVAMMKIKTSQTTARLIVALVARAGEGRRRVISDLTLALSEGTLGQINANGTRAVDRDNDEHEMWALQALGELCIGLAAPRSNGVNQDSNASLSFEVVRVMLECGMAHALMNGIRRIMLHHPLAANAAAALLRPLEVFTRPNVIDAVQAIADKALEQVTKLAKESEGEISGRNSRDGKKSNAELSRARRSTLGPSQRSEGAFADDAMLEDGFDFHTGERNARRHARRRGFEQIVDAMDYERMDDDEIEDIEDADEFGVVADNMDEVGESGSDSDDDDDEVDDIEVRLGNSDGSSEDDDDLESDINDEMSSEEGSRDNSAEIDDSDSNSGSDDDIDDDEDESDIEAEIEEEEVDEGEEFDWDEDDGDDFFEHHAVEVDEDAEDEGMSVEPDIDEGWTRIETSGLGRVFVGVRQGDTVQESSARRAVRAGGFIVEAAEAMIGNILRSSDIQMDALTEIENTLGIRIMHHRGNHEHRGPRMSSVGDVFASVAGRNSSTRNESINSRNLDPMGVVPEVHQSNPPDSGYLSLTPAGRFNDFNCMEYVYGGPAIGAGSRYYDLNYSINDSCQEVEDAFQVRFTVDIQLFPGGPAASTHSRTQPSPHPLLCGINLSPFNALVSVNRPHSMQNVMSSRLDGTIDSAWTSVLSGAGNVIRLNRGPTGPLLDRSVSASAGTWGGVGSWTDDGQPLDSTATEFGLAFEQSLANTFNQSASVTIASDSSVVGRPSEGERPILERPSTPPISNEGTDMIQSPNRLSNGDTPVAEAISSDAVMAITSQASPVDMETETLGDLLAPLGDPCHDGTTIATESSASEGDAVASSLAAGLTLSPRTADGVSYNPSSIPPEISRAVHGDRLLATTLGTDFGHQDTVAENHEQGTTMAESEVRHESIDSTSDDIHLHDLGIGVSVDTHNVRRTSMEGIPNGSGITSEPNIHGHICPPGMDWEVFNSLPFEMQQEIVEQHQATVTVAAQLDAASGLDPEALAALPDEMRREVIEQDQHERRLREQTPADPSNAEEMDNASFVASLAPDLREEILLTAEDSFLNSLPPDIIAEAHILRERASLHHRRSHEDTAAPALNVHSGAEQTSGHTSGDSATAGASSNRKRSRIGKLRVECDRIAIIYAPPLIERELGPLITPASMKALVRLIYLLSPVRPQRLLQKLFQNLCANSEIRKAFLSTFVALLHDDPHSALFEVNLLDKMSNGGQPAEHLMVDDKDDFPPLSLIGTAPEMFVTDSMTMGPGMFRRRQGSSAAASTAANLPANARGSSDDNCLPPLVARRLIGIISFLSKNASRISLDILNSFCHDNAQENSIIHLDQPVSYLDKLLDLLGRPLYSMSSTNLEELLNMIECIVIPLSLLPGSPDSEIELSPKVIDAASAAGKEWVDVPRTIVSSQRLQLLCSILRLETCKDASFQKVSTIARRLCKAKANRKCILVELASVAQCLGVDAIRDLKFLSIRLNDAVKLHQGQLSASQGTHSNGKTEAGGFVTSVSSTEDAIKNLLGGSPSSAVTLSTSSSEIKLLRVLQTLYGLSGGDSYDDSGCRKITDFLQSINLDSLWDQLTSCLRVVSVLEGVAHFEETDENILVNAESSSEENQNDDGDNNLTDGKKLQNSVAGLLTRFLPTIESFFVVNACSIGESKNSNSGKSSTPTGGTLIGSEQLDLDNVAAKSSTITEDSKSVQTVAGNKRLIEFVSTNKVLLNALLRSNSSLLDKGLRAMVQIPRCRPFLDFDVKRHWFKTQLRRLKQHASRRHGSLRLNIRRKHVFEDAYHQLRLRNADEMRGRLHITFRNEEGVDAGGLSREFFGILAKEMFNPNYALFTSTEDGCTFQPNPHSSINPDHLSYFRFVGRIVGKAVLDGFLLDAHFTRSLYKHMLGVKPTHHDMQAIDPDYYKNLKTILEYDLDEIGLELTFSTEVHSFGRSQTIDLIPNGRNVKVTEKSKETYVSLVCQYRMTTAIEKQIKAYLDGFNELVSSDLISVFTAKELELLISGLPDIDIHDLKKNTDYHDYKQVDKEIGWFWNILFSLSRSEKAAFLQFVTGSSKVPLSGFSELQGMRGIQKFSIHKAGGSRGALMSAHTCFNALDLPAYSSEEEMKEKLIYAINEGGGGFLFA